MSESDLMWKTESRERIFSCVLFDIEKDRRSSSDGRSGDFISVLSKDWIVAIPWFRNKDGVACFLMEDQFRHGSETVVREFPAGLVEKGEEHEAAARRELLEETGFRGDFHLLGTVNPNSAFMANSQSFFFVDNLEKIAGQSLDENEQIKIVEVPVKEAIENMGKGIYSNGIMMGALGFFLRYSMDHPEYL